MDRRTAGAIFIYVHLLMSLMEEILFASRLKYPWAAVFMFFIVAIASDNWMYCLFVNLQSPAIFKC